MKTTVTGTGAIKSGFVQLPLGTKTITYLIFIPDELF